MKDGTKPPLVSAVVSTYKAERFLRGKLEDLEAQTIAHELEIIVIDSASPEDERGIVEEFQSRYDNIRYLRTDKRETVYQAWNRGIGMATGEFVANANTDDRLRNDAYELLVRTLREHPECVLAYPDMRITLAENGSFDNHVPYGFKSWPPYSLTSLLELCCVGPFPLWRRSLHDEIGYFDERYQCIADYEFWLRAAKRHSFIHVPQFLGLYWLNENTVSRNGDLPTLEYLYIQKLYREKFAHLIPGSSQENPALAQVLLALTSRVESGEAPLGDLERFAADHPELARAQHDLARLYYKNGDIGLARKHYEKAVLLDPSSPLFAESLEGFLRLELYQSLKLQKGELGAEPDNLANLLCAGLICVMLGRREAAAGFFRKALEIDPDNAPARGHLASCEEACSVAEPEGYYRFPRPEVQRVVSRRARRVLDVGCGAGELALALKRRQGAEVWGVEPSAQAAGAAAKALDRVLALPIEKALHELPARHFSSIILADVLEHLVDPEEVLSGLKEKLSGGGEVIVTLPNVAHWSVVQGLLQGSFEYEEAGILDRTHLRFFTRKSALALFERAGYAVTCVTPIALAGDAGMPQALLQALQQSGAAGPALEQESSAYQYLFRLVPKGEELTSIVILTWNELDCTRECLESIERNTPEPHEVILVDNGSSDGTLPYLREFCRERSGFHLIENGSNLGFAKGCNIGMRAASGGRILLLNNDTVVTRGWLSGLIDALEREPGAGIAGPMTNEIAGPQKVAAPAYRNHEELEAFADAFRSGNYGRRIPAKRLVGFCMLFTRELYEEVGELDERFGSGNFEDDDFCLRAALSGYGCVIAGDVFIHHYGSRSFAGNKVDYAAAMAKNRRAFDAKWDPAQLPRQTALQLISHNAIAKGERLAREGREGEAVELLLQEGIGCAQGSPLPYLTLAGLLAGAGNYGNALEVLAESPAGEELAVALLKGRCHRGLGDHHQAEQMAQQALSLDPEAAQALQLQGLLVIEKGDPEGGAELLRRAIDRDPGCAPAYGALACLMWERGERERALQMAELSFVLAPLDMEALTRYHEYATACKQLPREEQRLDEALAIYPNHKGLSYAVIELLVRAGRYPEAIGEIEKAAVRFGMDDQAIDAALQIRGLAGTPAPASRGTGSVSLCMIVKDEAKTLAAALFSARGLADELVVVDTGSGDRTCDVARIFGARLFSFPWNGSFADARNFSLQQANGDWILVLDADERLAPRDLAPLAEMVRNADRPTAFSFTTRNYTTEIARRNWSANAGEYPAEERGSGWTPSEKVRLFPNDPRLRFEGAVHELLEGSLIHAGIPIHACDVPVHHYGKLDQARNAQKQEAYYLLGLQKIEETGASVESLSELARQATELNRAEEAQGLWHRLLKAHPENAEAYFNLGYLQLSAGRYREAHAHALRGAELAPGMKEAAFNLAKCELFLGNIDLALCSCREMLDKWPDYPPALSLLCVCLLLAGRGTEAQEVARKLSALRFDCADFLNEYANGFTRGERGDLALPVLAFAGKIAAGGAP